MDHKFKTKWESDNMIIFDKKDSCGYDQGFSWPQRNFMCNFCNKEYKSAQALGGHMNVHRRDRARLRLSSPPNPNPNPTTNTNPNPNYVSPIRYLPYKTYHSGIDFLGCMRKGMIMEDGEDKEEENGIRVWKKNEIFNLEMEMGLLTDGKIELDLELRLGRS